MIPVTLYCKCKLCAADTSQTRVASMKSKHVHTIKLNCLTANDFHLSCRYSLFSSKLELRSGVLTTTYLQFRIYKNGHKLSCSSLTVNFLCGQ